VKTQIWIAVSMYVLVAIARKRWSWRQASTKLYRFLVSTFSRERPFHRHLEPLDIEANLLGDPNQTDFVRSLTGQQ